MADDITPLLDDALARILTEPSWAQQIVTETARMLQTEDPFEPLTLRILDANLAGAAYTITNQLPDAVVIDATEHAVQALPLIHPRETPDAYALRLLQIARTI